MTTTYQNLVLPGKPSTTKTILWATLVSGSLDALAGVIVYLALFGYNPFQVLQSIAEGIYGPAAFKGGLLTVSAGLVLHYLIAFVVSILFFYAYPKIKILSKYNVVSGLLFGAAIWLVMNLVVVPLSNIPASPFNPLLAFLGISWHMVLVGLPIALITKAFYTSTENK